MSNEHHDLRTLMSLWGKHGTAWIQQQLQAQGAVLGATAYLVWIGEYEDRDVVGVFATAAKAQQYADALSGTAVQEMPVDADLPPRVARGEKSWYVRVDLADGRLLDKLLWDRLAYEPLVAVRNRYQKELDNQSEFVFEWTGWETEEKLLEVVEDARQAWVAKYGVALEPPEPRYAAPPPPHELLVRERAGRLRLEEMYRDLADQLEAKALAGSAGAKLASAVLAEKGVLTPSAIAGLVEDEWQKCVEAVPVVPRKRADLVANLHFSSNWVLTITDGVNITTIKTPWPVVGGTVPREELKALLDAHGVGTNFTWHPVTP